MKERLNHTQIHSINYIQFIRVNSELSTPKLYTLLSEKKKANISIFNSTLNLCHTNKISLNPTIDFEQSAIFAVKLIFPNAITKGCNFHFNKCIYTKLQDLGFQSAFINKKLSDINEINIRNLYKKKYAHLHLYHHEKLVNYG